MVFHVAFQEPSSKQRRDNSNYISKTNKQKPSKQKQAKTMVSKATRTETWEYECVRVQSILGLLAMITRGTACLSDAPLYLLTPALSGLLPTRQTSRAWPHLGLCFCLSLSLTGLTPGHSLAGFWSLFRPVVCIEKSHLFSNLSVHTHIHSAPCLLQHLLFTFTAMWDCFLLYLWEYECEILLFPYLGAVCPTENVNVMKQIWLSFLRQGSAVSYHGLKECQILTTRPSGMVLGFEFQQSKRCVTLASYLTSSVKQR